MKLSRESVSSDATLCGLQVATHLLPLHLDVPLCRGTCLQICLSARIFSLYKDRSQIELEPTPGLSLTSSHLWRPYCQLQSLSEVMNFRTSHMNWGRGSHTIQSTRGAKSITSHCGTITNITKNLAKKKALIPLKPLRTYTIKFLFITYLSCYIFGIFSALYWQRDNFQAKFAYWNECINS